MFGPFAALGLDELLSLFRTVEDAIEGARTPPVHAPTRDEHGSAAVITDPA